MFEGKAERRLEDMSSGWKDYQESSSWKPRISGILGTVMVVWGLYSWDIAWFLLGAYTGGRALKLLAWDAGHKCQQCNGSGVDRR